MFHINLTLNYDEPWRKQSVKITPDDDSKKDVPVLQANMDKMNVASPWECFADMFLNEKGQLDFEKKQRIIDEIGTDGYDDMVLSVAYANLFWKNKGQYNDIDFHNIYLLTCLIMQSYLSLSARLDRIRIAKWLGVKESEITAEDLSVVYTKLSTGEMAKSGRTTLLPFATSEGRYAVDHELSDIWVKALQHLWNTKQADKQSTDESESEEETKAVKIDPPAPTTAEDKPGENSGHKKVKAPKNKSAETKVAQASATTKTPKQPKKKDANE